MTSWLPSDVRDAWRSLAGRPGFSLLLLLTLGLGIGATTTIVSFTYALLFRPYPYETPDRLVRVQTVATKHGGARQNCSLRDIEDYRRRASRLVDIGAYTVFDTRLLTDGPPEVISMSQLNTQALSLLGVRPIVGRLLRPEEDVVGGDVHKVVLSYDLWMSRFGGDREIAGKPFRTDRRTYTIVGVMPPGFRFPDRVDAWGPMESWYANLPPEDDRRLKPRERRIYATIARIRPDVSLAEAEADLNRVAAELEREFPKENDGFRVALTPLRDFEIGAVRPYVLVCAAGVGMVLLIGCVNVANLLLVRAAAQRRVVAVKLALGASAARIARGLLAESLLLGLAGSALGLLFAMAGVQGLLALIPVPLPAWMRITIDAPILAFTIAVGLATAIVFGLVPMMSAARVALTSALREGARGSARSRMRSGLVIAEIALSVVLLVGAALLMQTFVRLQERHPGFEVGGLATARVVAWAPGTRAQSASVLNNIHGRVLTALRNLPGVSVAAVGNDLPYAAARTERLRADVYIRGRAAEETKTIVPIVGTDASADYFSALRIPLRRGRTIDATDTETSEPVVVISERAARMFWPNQDPVGQYLCWGKPGPDNPWTRVVGVVGDVKLHAAEGEAGIELYYPITQWPVASSYYVVRTMHDPDQILDTIRRTILTADPTLAVRYVKTLERAVTESLWQRRLWGVLFTAFSVLALGLASVGVYGVVSYAVTQRQREMGIRLALGAAPGRVRGLVIGESMRLCAIGIVLGLGGAFALARAMSGLLFGVPAHDPITFLLVTLTIGGVCLLACWLPAVQASRVNPITVLRDA
jgi:putative ABC transport system permease protein